MNDSEHTHVSSKSIAGISRRKMNSQVSAVAQEESRNISENIKWGYQRKFERGEIQTKYKNFMGYTEKNGELVVVPEEAAIVKRIFELYADGYSIRKICNYLEDKGIKTKTGKTK